MFPWSLSHIIIPSHQHYSHQQFMFNRTQLRTASYLYYKTRNLYFPWAIALNSKSQELVVSLWKKWTASTCLRRCRPPTTRFLLIIEPFGGISASLPLSSFPWGLYRESLSNAMTPTPSDARHTGFDYIRLVYALWLPQVGWGYV